jgi:hypothetical protein
MTTQAPIGTGDERWPRIAVGLAFASLAAGYTLALLIFLPDALRGYLPSLGWFLLMGFLFFILICLLAALPAVYVISLAEARRWHSAAFYAAAGAGVALFCAGVVLLLSGALSAGRGVPGAMWALANGALMLGLPGLVGGLVYWRIAGRTAGREP